MVSSHSPRPFLSSRGSNRQPPPSHRVGYGMTFWTGPNGKYWGWRVSILFQIVPAVIFAAGLFFVPET